MTVFLTAIGVPSPDKGFETSAWLEAYETIFHRIRRITEIVLAVKRAGADVAVIFLSVCDTVERL
ncbi:MAG: hypothetical protein L6V93_05880 [Clostridiales bacterium]|nr:MAG: hypothetical protein L6V93_05880 [Clostridiales bacterium]